MIEVPCLQTKRIALRPLTEAQVASYERHFIDYEVIRHLASTVPWPYPENGVSEFIRQKVVPFQGICKWAWGIFLHENQHELIGVIELWRTGTPENRGFWLGQRYWGMGLMSEAVSITNDFAFNILKFDELILTNAKGNIRSRRIKEKTGAILIKVEPAKYVDPLYTEREIWKLTKHCWRQTNPI